MSQDTTGTIRPGILTLPERLAFAFARATAAASSELIHQIHAVTVLAKQGPEPFPLDGLLVFAMLALFEVADHDDGLLRPTKQLLEPCQQTGLCDLASHVASQPELAENVLVVEGCESSVEFVLLLDVRLEAFEIYRFPVERAQLRFPLHHSLTIDHLLLALLQVVAILLRFRLLAARVLGITELGLLLGIAIHTVK